MFLIPRALRTLCLLGALAFAPLALADEEAGADAVLGDLARGEVLYDLCSQCHGADGSGNPGVEAPAIAGLPGWYVDSTLRKFKAGGRGAHPDDIAGMRMRPMSLWLRNDEDIVHVTAYVATLPPVRPAPTLEGGDAARGAALYAPCIACHMPDGSGNPALGSPPLKWASDWYLLSQLQKFKGGIRGTNPMDANGALMVGMAQTLADEQAMRDVIAHITTLSE
ncbi:MAG: c-type cytochrome [Myxococcales bacterium]|nr:c-type cytochrome [Myxococcales bacterium]